MELCWNHFVNGSNGLESLDVILGLIFLAFIIGIWTRKCGWLL